MKELLLLAREIYEGNESRGFWSEGSKRNKGNTLALIHSEVTEAFECFIGLGDGKPKTEFPLIIEELADVAIRILDYVYGYGCLTVDNINADMTFKRDPGIAFEVVGSVSNMADRLMIINMYISRALEDLRHDRDEFDNLYFALCSVKRICYRRGFELHSAVEAKLKYNATRPFKHGKNF